MAFNPLTNRAPIALLKNHELVKLKEWPHGWLVYDDRMGWVEINRPSWLVRAIYRGRPAPREEYQV